MSNHSVRDGSLAIGLGVVRLGVDDDEYAVRQFVEVCWEHSLRTSRAEPLGVQVSIERVRGDSFGANEVGVARRPGVAVGKPESTGTAE